MYTCTCTSPDMYIDYIRTMTDGLIIQLESVEMQYKCVTVTQEWSSGVKSDNTMQKGKIHVHVVMDTFSEVKITVRNLDNTTTYYPTQLKVSKLKTTGQPIYIHMYVYFRNVQTFLLVSK